VSASGARADLTLFLPLQAARPRNL